MTDRAAIDPMNAIRARAAEWIVQIEGAASEEERHASTEACRNWLSLDARHALVFRQMQGMWFPVDAPRPNRKVPAVIAAIAVALCAALLPTERWLADQQTAFGEVRRVSLADVDPGEELLLINYEHQAAHSPYRAKGPIFVSKHGALFDGADVPPALRTRLL